MEQNKKRNILITVWSLAAVALLAAAGYFAYYFIYKFPVYENHQLKFSVRYPHEWKKMEGIKGAAIVFVRPKQSALDIFEPNFSITIQEVPDKIATLSSFSEK